MVTQVLNWLYGTKPCACKESKENYRKAFKAQQKEAAEACESIQRVNQGVAIIKLANAQIAEAIEEIKKKDSGQHPKV